MRNIFNITSSFKHFEQFTFKSLQIFFDVFFVFSQWSPISCTDSPFNHINLVVRALTRQLKLQRCIEFFPVLEVPFKNFLDMFSVPSNPGFFSEHFWIFSDTWLDSGTKRSGIFERRSHFVSFWGRFDPDWLLTISDPICCSFYPLERTDWLVVVILFNKVCELSSCNSESFGVSVKLFIKRLQIPTVWSLFFFTRPHNFLLLCLSTTYFNQR